MAFRLASAFVDIVARMGGLDRSLGQVRSEVGGLLSSLNTVGGALGITLGIGGAIAAAKSFIASATEAQFAEARLGAVIKATGGAAGFAKDEILELSSVMASKTTFGDDEISAAAAKMLTFKKVTGDTFKSAMGFAADLAATGFGSIEAASVQLAKALEDPIKGIGALRRAGVSFTESEKAKIKSLVKSNNLLAAQNIILDAVKTQVGGAAEALAKTPAGQWMQIQNLIGEIGEEFGKRILPAVVQFGRLALGLSSGFLAAFDAVARFNTVLGGWPVKIAVVVGLLSQIPNIIGLMRLATSKLISTIIAGQLFTGWGIILVAIGSIAVAIYEITRYFAGIPAIQEAWAAGLKKVLYAWEVIKSAVRTIGEAIMNELRPVLDWMGVTFTGTFDWMQQGIVGVITNAIDFFAELIADAAEWIHVIVTNWQTALDIVLTGLSFLGSHIYDVVSKNASYAFGYFAGRGIKAMTDFGTWFVLAAANWVAIFGNALVQTIMKVPGWIAQALAEGEIAIATFTAKLAGEMSKTIAALNTTMTSEGAKLGAGFADGLSGRAGAFDLGISDDNKKRLKDIGDMLTDLDEKKRAFGDERNAFFAKPLETPKMPEMPTQQIEHAVELDLKGGMMGITDAWAKVQEAIIARDAPGERSAQALEAGVGLWEKQEEHLAGINTKLGGMEAGAIA